MDGRNALSDWPAGSKGENTTLKATSTEVTRLASVAQSHQGTSEKPRCVLQSVHAIPSEGV